jgi:hypothetical protein
MDLAALLWSGSIAGLLAVAVWSPKRWLSCLSQVLVLCLLVDLEVVAL